MGLSTLLSLQLAFGLEHLAVKIKTRFHQMIRIWSFFNKESSINIIYNQFIMFKRSIIRVDTYVGYICATSPLIDEIQGNASRVTASNLAISIPINNQFTLIKRNWSPLLQLLYKSYFLLDFFIHLTFMNSIINYSYSVLMLFSYMYI